MKYTQWLITFANGFKISETIVTSWIIMAALIIIAFLLTRNLKPVPTTKKQIMLEYAVGSLRNLVHGNMGDDVEKECQICSLILDPCFFFSYVPT